jgi:hypothetical protein
VWIVGGARIGVALRRDETRPTRGLLARCLSLWSYCSMGRFFGEGDAGWDSPTRRTPYVRRSGTGAPRRTLPRRLGPGHVAECTPTTCHFERRHRGFAVVSPPTRTLVPRCARERHSDPAPSLKNQGRLLELDGVGAEEPHGQDTEQPIQEFPAPRTSSQLIPKALAAPKVRATPALYCTVRRPIRATKNCPLI